MSFYCSVCNIRFSDSHAAEVHKASLKHKRRSGESEMEERLYKKDEEVTVADVMALMQRSGAALELRPWAELRYEPPAAQD